MWDRIRQVYKQRDIYVAHLQRTFRQAPWRTRTQTAIAATVLLLVAAVMGGLYLSLAARAGVAGRDLQQLEAQQEELQRANDELLAQLATLRSVTRLANRARELGFVPLQPEEIEYLPVPNYPVAMASQPPRETPSSPTVHNLEWLEQVMRILLPRGG